MAEVKLVDHFGASLFGGFGQVDAEDATGDEFDVAVWELGAQLGWYPLGTFDKLVLGAELTYLEVRADELPDTDVAVVGSGLAVGPLVGYKFLTSVGFTFVAQAGFQYVALSAEAEEDAAVVDEDERSRILPLLNLNVGWSF
jgi:hypothetical protein